jgi:drug/metabolite transporter (DMT)-like permease
VPGGIVFLYVLATGVVMAAAAGVEALAGANWTNGSAAAVASAARAGTSASAPPFTAEILLYLLAQALGPTLLAYIFWETAMRFGSVTLVASAAYLTPVFSLIASCIVLQRSAGWGLWVGSALVVAGAVVCRLSIREARAPAPSGA